MVFLQIIIFILILSFLVVIHELGHYITARIFKVRVEEFGIGYPPRALTLFKKGKTIFSLNWIPFGGFVKMEGEEGSEVDGLSFEDVSPTEIEKAEKQRHPDKHEGPFYAKSRFARLVIALAGAFINFIFGIFAFSLFFSITGIPEIITAPRIGEIVSGSPAEAAKIPVNVNVIAVQFSSGEKIQITSPQQMTEVISPRVNQDVTVFTTGECKVDGAECQESLQQFTAKIAPRPDDSTKGFVGIRFANVIQQKFYPWYEMPVRGTWTGLQQTYFLSQMIFEALGNMGKTILHGALPAEVGSPVKIFVEGKKAGIFDQGPWALLNFAGIISVNLAIFNVLPIPALDGGRVFLILLELVIGRKRVNKVEGYVNYAGFILLGGLMIVVFAKDILDIVLRRG